ncbi:SDR family oxidoreductase [Parvibaculum sp.]|uniref:SDR family NAD(P)-dependent oxidoreductase n=1 Tax=Parvibaculum sp. TaxID=2024848 RepID=UPI0027318437|nr:SDR family NAD(P)-dependent oxidoreductase [Parvibaculum sp.]MDP1626664.1 SDR family NAD(P)-dependent oxidoreductase [Parvibaculum sp.]MDP2150585.1 SDR family NAD(P)-dependent oxidoreductase [Parvibaculum sp.]MDP3330053.1 SDR family NAD(P)-dependent oxidoreductase [Parvibaculum sp.]
MSGPRKALVTGAGGGIGAAISRALDARGYHLILVDREMAPLDAVAATLRSTPEKILCDLSSRADVERLCGTVANAHPDLDVLVNNAGIGIPGPVVELGQDLLDAHLEINLRAPVRLMRAIAPQMIARGHGSMVATVSLGGIISLKDSAIYSASKFGLRGFLAGFHQEMAAHGVRVSGVYPAAVDTPMLHHEALHGGSVLNFVDRVMSPEDIAKATVKAIETGKLEVYAPWSASLMARFFGAFPWMIRPILPLMERIGEKGRLKFIARKGFSAQQH